MSTPAALSLASLAARTGVELSAVVPGASSVMSRSSDQRSSGRPWSRWNRVASSP